MDSYVAALAYERAGYLRARKADRVALVDKELARLGFECDKNGKVVTLEAKKPRAAKERAVAKAPERAVED